ncbi:MAG: peptidase S8 [Flavobacteriales bacterium]|nr:MAG: peptidase S8 [Flavobacteriales bacterium]
MKHYLLPVFILLFGLSLQAQTPQQKQQIRQKSNVPQLLTLSDTYKTKKAAAKQKALAMAKQNNWPVTLEKNGAFMELQMVTDDGKPIYFTTYNADAARSTRTNFLHSGGGLGLNVEGQNMTAHVWDSGLALASHQEYDGPGGNNRFSVGDGTSTLNYHSAHVTGTIISSGVDPQAKGMAPQASAVGYDWDYDTSEASTAAGNGMMISNHSYGYGASNIPDQWFGAYRSDAHDWDEIMYNAPYYLMVVAAGNDGGNGWANGSPLDGNSGYDKLSGHATAKNNMVVANAQDASIDSNGNLNSVSINSSSSQGPTDDYRIKPDITGNGTGVYSTYESSSTAYSSISGTSMASPNVAGSLLILQQHYNNVKGSFMYAATLKGLALHTADDAGSTGPDAVFGWGLLNTKRAAETITNEGTESLISELTLSQGQTYTIDVTSDGINDLMASISWTDPAGTENSSTNSSTPALVNDLDIRVSNGTTYYPYKLTSITTNDTGDNLVDPFERVDVSNASGVYTITVTHKGSLSGGSQKFSLIVTGLANNVTCNATTPTNFNATNVSDTTAQLSWNAVAGATYDLRYKKTSDSSWQTQGVTGSSFTLTGLTTETAYEAQIRSKCSDGSTSSYTSSVNFTTLAFQLNYCASQGNSVNDEYIQRVQLNLIDNSSGASSGYTDFTNISTPLAQGETYTITITPKWTGSTYKEGYAVWIDYNHDGDFDDADEAVWTKSASTTSPVSGTFTVPQGTVLTDTRMRVSMKYNGTPTSCETFNYGEVEDYTVSLTGSTGDTEAPTAPTLSYNNLTTNSVDLSWTGSTDNVAVTEYNVYQGTTLLGSTTNTEYQVTGLTPDTAYSFKVNALDAAGNTSPDSNTLNLTTLSNPGGDCTDAISVYPYNEGFENTFGLWTQSNADDFDWTLKSGSTPSTGTGPSGATEGSYYVYMESSSPNYSNKQAILNSPCFDLSALTQANLSFKYHMYGKSTMGSLTLEVSTDNGSTWAHVWSKSGNQGNDWFNANIDLSGYTGGTIQLRFNGMTGTTWQGDMAIDAFKITDSAASGCVAATLSITFDNYPEETSWEITSESGSVVFSGGTYGSQPDGSTLEIPLCIEAGCYTFTIKDSYGDGMCCSYGNGSYTLSRESDGSVLASGGSFGSSEATDFCLNTYYNAYTTYAQNDQVMQDLVMYPNPATDYIQVVLKDTRMSHYTITNTFGQVVQQGDLSSNTINVSKLSSGVYVINFNSDKKVLSEKLMIK